MNYWLSNNYDQAQINVLNMTIGKLEAMMECKITATPEELLKYIEKAVADEEKRLDEKFPTHARISK